MFLLKKHKNEKQNKLSFLSKNILAIILLVCAVFFFEGHNLITGEPDTDSGTNDIQKALQESQNLKMAKEIAASFSANELCAQVIMTGLDSSGALSAYETAALKEIPAGAIMLFRKNLNTKKDGVQKLNNGINDCYNFVKPFIAVDHEGGTVQRFADDVPRLDSAFSYFLLAESSSTALQQIKKDAFESGTIIHSLGITMNLAPVAEVLNDQNKNFLQTRTYGSNGDFVAAACTAFIEGMNAAGIACVVKHFPGNTGDDPHYNKPVLNVSPEALVKMTQPFHDVFTRANPAAVMVSHVIVPEWDNAHNASLSKIVIEDIIKGKFNFNGIVLADDFSMGAVAGTKSPQDNVVDAIINGADMVMTWPSDFKKTYTALLNALSSGKLSRSRLENAATRIILQKIRIGVISEKSKE
ncbi:MAG: glycoside hydrolase family 3 protein [Spirochaetaceae bacterium]|jgi:beta-N-acetylhexosaminidase|nr:glycoside hydrolase family 3 protein [Spirochaetaceae bacterium]